MKHFFQFMICFCIVYNACAMNYNEKKYPKRSFNQVSPSHSVLINCAKLPASKKRKIMTKLDCEKFLQSLTSNCVTKVCQYIEEFDFDLNKPLFGDFTPLSIAIQKGHLDMVKRLVGCNAECSTKYKGEFYISIMNARCIIMSYLINRFSINVNRPLEPKSLKTPLHYAFEKKSLPLIKVLIEDHNAEFVSDYQGYLPIAYLARTDINLRCVRDILEYLFGFNETSNINAPVSLTTGATLLHEAVKNGNLDLIKILVGKYDAQIQSIDYDNKTPLNRANELFNDLELEKLKDIINYLQKKEQ